jgi:hypothetical protein
MTRQWLSVLAVAGVSACAKPPLFLLAEPRPAAMELTYLGLDFSHAVFADGDFELIELKRRFLPEWNATLAEELPGRLRARIAIDTGVASERNARIDESSLHSVAEGSHPRGPAAEVVAAEAEPYRSQAGGLAMLIVVDQLTRLYGVAAHAVIFERATGRALLVAAEEASGGGSGLRSFYLSPLREIAIGMTDTINAYWR